MEGLKTDDEFLRKFMGLQQCSKDTLHLSIVDGFINIRREGSDDTIASLTRKEFNEWPSYKILEVAGVPVI